MNRGPYLLPSTPARVSRPSVPPVQGDCGFLYTRLFFMLVAVLSACSRPTPTIVLDDSWNEGFARDACQSLPKKTPSCQEDQVRNVRVFEIELTTQFAAQSECSGVKITRLRDPGEVNRAAASLDGKRSWTLTLNYMPGSRTQEWHMLSTLPPATVTKGEGSPAEIAAATCKIANGRGATQGGAGA